MFHSSLYVFLSLFTLSIASMTNLTLPIPIHADTSFTATLYVSPSPSATDTEPPRYADEARAALKELCVWQADVGVLPAFRVRFNIYFHSSWDFLSSQRNNVDVPMHRQPRRLIREAVSIPVRFLFLVSFSLYPFAPESLHFVLYFQRVSNPSCVHADFILGLEIDRCVSPPSIKLIKTPQIPRQRGGPRRSALRRRGWQRGRGGVGARCVCIHVIFCFCISGSVYLGRKSWDSYG